MNIRLLAVLLAVSSMCIAQTPDPCATAPQTCATLIETHATSEMRIPNTAVDVVVGMSASGKDLPKVQRALADQSDKLLAYLKAQKVERLITTGVSFASQMTYEKAALDKTVGYDGSARISFRTNPDKIADILTGVLENGANTIQSTTFRPTEEEIAEARRHLSEDATKTAVAQADVIAKAAGMKVVAIRNISVDSSGYQQPSSTTGQLYLDDFGVMSARARAPSPPIQAVSGDNQLSVQVNIVAAATR